ncbi:MAG TPA: DUF6768 family protein [Caulobacter sp.]|nr:DUF6768 family protein [Caulobacter sp.]
MTQIDDVIRRAISPDDLRLLDELGREEPILVQAMKAFEHQERWVGLVGWLGGFAMFGVGAWCVFQFATTEDLAAMIRWGAGAGLAAAGLAMIKLWFFMEMQKNSIIRELKRLELHLASLRALVDAR